MEGIERQISSLMILFWTGLAWGLLYDCFVLLFRKRRQLGDFAFWISLIFLTFPVLLLTTWGELRVSLGVSLLMGVACYRRVFHPSVYLSLRLVKGKLRRRRGFFT
ncbi:MAG TPA: hypothetical protein GXZ98_07535 [Firmicutes bacterium]|nr:hypothetical protein [Bacillota bacterium]